MKFKTIVFTFLAVLASPAFTQTGTVVERAFACSVINGYTINDVASVMRAYEWDEDFAPRVVVLREVAYGTDEFREDWDFVVSLYYTSMVELTEKRLAFRARTGGSDGYDLSDVARCSNSPRINSIDFVPGPGNGGDAPELTAAMTTSCEYSPAVTPLALGETAAGLFGPNLRNVQIVNRQYGGPSQAMGARFGLRATFNSPEGMSEAMDALRVNQPEQVPPCNIPSIWLQHRIYARGN